MTSERWFVVKAEPCERFLPGVPMPAEWCERFAGIDDACDDCLHNGLRAARESAVEVEPKLKDYPDAGCWVATERTEQ